MEVERRGGRFLKKGKKDVAPGNAPIWIVQSVDVAILKIKQVCSKFENCKTSCCDRLG